MNKSYCNKVIWKEFIESNFFDNYKKKDGSFKDKFTKQGMGGNGTRYFTSGLTIERSKSYDEIYIMIHFLFIKTERKEVPAGFLGLKKKMIDVDLEIVGRQYFQIDKTKPDNIEDRFIHKYTMEEHINSNKKLGTVAKKFIREFINLRKEYDNIIKSIHSKKAQDDVSKQNKINIKNNKIINSSAILLNRIDPNGDGRIDLVETKVYAKLLTKNSHIVDDFHPDGIHSLVKLDKYLKGKEKLLVKIFNVFRKTNNPDKLKFIIKILELEYKLYCALTFNGVNMITSCINKDKITYFTIYESFDELGIFKSQHEKEVGELLNGVSKGISKLSNQINTLSLQLNQMSSQLNVIQSTIYNGFLRLEYTNKESFYYLSKTLGTELKSIGSKLDVGNFISLVNTYQAYKINKRVSSNN